MAAPGQQRGLQQPDEQNAVIAAAVGEAVKSSSTPAVSPASVSTAIVLPGGTSGGISSEVEAREKEIQTLRERTKDLENQLAQARARSPTVEVRSQERAPSQFVGRPSDSFWGAGASLDACLLEAEQRCKTGGPPGFLTSLVNFFIPAGNQPCSEVRKYLPELKTSSCRRKEQIPPGEFRDGSWIMCADPGPRPGGVVYAAGARDDITFDIGVKEKGLEVHTFDPTLKLQEIDGVVAQATKAGVKFHDIGLGGANKVYLPMQMPYVWPGVGGGTKTNDEAWRIYTLGGLLALLNHTAIEILKIDIEGAEWDFFEEALRNPQTAVFSRLESCGKFSWRCTTCQHRRSFPQRHRARSTRRMLHLGTTCSGVLCRSWSILVSR